MVALCRPLPLAGLCLALLPALACVTPDPSLPYLCDITDGGGCPKGSYCGLAADGERRCLPLDEKLDAGKADASSLEPDASPVPPDAAAEPPDAAAEEPDASAEPADASGMRPDAKAEPADASPTPPDATATEPADAGRADASRPDGGGAPDASPECIVDSHCPFCERCSGNVCVPQSATEDLKGECPDDRLCATGTCDGERACGLKPSTAVCRPAVLGCDLEEKCDGLTDRCPNDTFKQANTVCRQATLPCDKEDRCSGTSADCPDDKQPSTVKCAEATCVGNSVSPASYCNGGSTTCPTAPINSCGNYTCRNSACLTGCTSHGDCVSGVCDLRALPGTCIALASVAEPDCEAATTNLQAVIDKCTAGTPCYIKPKSYGACDAIAIKGKDVTIVGGTIHPATGHGPGVSVEEGNGETTTVFLHGMTIESASGSVPGGIHAFPSASSTGRPELTATRCTIRNNGLYGVHAYKAKLVLDGCEVTANATHGAYLQSTEATVQNSLFSRNGQWGLDVVTPSGTQVFRFNTVVHNTGGAVRCDSTTTPTLASSLFWGNLPQGCAVEASSDVPGGADACANASDEPGFVDPTNTTSGNFHLNPASPCVDRQTCSVATDFDGQPRPEPAGDTCDVGADEVQ